MLKKTGTLSSGKDLDFKSCVARTAVRVAVVLEELGKLSENIFSWEINIEEVQSDPVSEGQSLQGKKINKFISVFVCDKSPPKACLTQLLPNWEAVRVLSQLQEFDLERN